jgi:membrane protease subunit HflC
MLSEAQRAATLARGEGDAEANKTLSDAYSKDPQFYSIYRSLQTYRSALANAAPTVLVSPDADFMRLLKSGPQTGSPDSPSP